MVPDWLGMLERLLCDTHARHIYEVVSWTPSPTRNTRPVAYAELSQKLSQTPFRLTHTDMKNHSSYELSCITLHKGKQWSNRATVCVEVCGRGHVWQR